MPDERIYFSQNEKTLTDKGVSLHSEYWNKRCEVLLSPEFQKQHMTKETKPIKIEARSGVFRNYSDHLNARPKNEETHKISNTSRYVKSSGVFKTRTIKIEQRDIINLMLMS